MKLLSRLLFVVLLLVASLGVIVAQDDLAAVLEVLSADVQVQRVNTANPLPVTSEAIVGVGDTIFTGEAGRARITFFVEGISTELLPNTTYVIQAFNGTSDEFHISVDLLIGQTIQQLQRALGATSSYEVNTPAMTLAARGTEFKIRVETRGRSGMIVTDGTVATTSDVSSADVPLGFGIRGTKDGVLSDVVAATTFDELDSALDGCTVSIPQVDDMSLNMRQGPTLDQPVISYVPPSSVTTVIGIIDGGNWYRIETNHMTGWILSSSLSLDSGCAGLRVFAPDYVEPTSNQ